MKKQFVKYLMPFGLFFISMNLFFARYNSLSDLTTGLLFGIGIGLALLPLILKKIKPTNY